VTSASDRLAPLDALRGIAAISVLLFHYTSNFEWEYGHPVPPPFNFGLGHYGVELFFMISGFVILMTLSRKASVAQFAYARFSRLFPVYWASVLTTFAIITAFGLRGHEISATDLLANLTMIQPIFGVPHVDYVYWTLWVELRFYLLMGLIFWLPMRRALIPILVGLVLLNTIDLTFNFTEKIPGWWRIVASIPMRQLCYFLVGIVLYEAWRDGVRFRTALLLTFCYASAVAGYQLGSETRGSLIQHAVVIATFILAMYFASLKNPRMLQSKVLVFFGTISYATYLIHHNVGSIVLLEAYDQGLSPTTAIACAMVVALALATMLTFLVEKPAARFLRKFDTAKTAAVNHN